MITSPFLFVIGIYTIVNSLILANRYVQTEQYGRAVFNDLAAIGGGFMMYWSITP